MYVLVVCCCDDNSYDCVRTISSKVSYATRTRGPAAKGPSIGMYVGAVHGCMWALCMTVEEYGQRNMVWCVYVCEVGQRAVCDVLLLYVVYV
jgi:hypothetical protein